MRSDASALLTKLNQVGLNYREFSDPLADLELWPVFEALLADPRVIETKRSRVEEREFQFQQARAYVSEGEGSEGAKGATSPRAVDDNGDSRVDSVRKMLSIYESKPKVEEDGPAAKTRTGAGKVDLRAFLSRLGEKPR